MYEDVAAAQTELLGANDPTTLDTRSELAFWLARIDRGDEALTILEDVLARWECVDDPDVRQVLFTKNTKAFALTQTGPLDEAVALYEQVLADRTRELRPDHPDTLMTRSHLLWARAWKASEEGNLALVAAAIPEYERHIEVERQVRGCDSANALATREQFAYWLEQLDRFVEAIAVYEELLDDRTRVLGKESLVTIDTREHLKRCRRIVDGARGGVETPVDDPSRSGPRRASSESAPDMERVLGDRAAWRRCSPDVLEELCVSTRAPGRLANLRFPVGYQVELPFGSGNEMFDVQIEGVDGVERSFMVWSGSTQWWLDGGGGVLQDLNDGEGLHLYEREVIDHLRWSVFAIRADNGAFVVLDRPELVTDDGAGPEHLSKIRSAVVPMRLVDNEPDGRFVVECSIAFDGNLFTAQIAVATDGAVEMIDDEPLDELDGLSVPRYPPLTPLVPNLDD